jgi:hypothetical protein
MIFLLNRKIIFPPDKHIIRKSVSTIKEKDDLSYSFSRISTCYIPRIWSRNRTYLNFFYNRRVSCSSKGVKK